MYFKASSSHLKSISKVNVVKSAKIDEKLSKSSEGLTYNNSKLDIYKLKSLEIPIIQECHDLCSCDVKKCPNRVIQHGIQNRLEIFRTESKGWGLRSPQRIQKATVIRVRT